MTLAGSTWAGTKTYRKQPGSSRSAKESSSGGRLLDMSTVLVFAGHSFLGQALCTVLRERGAHVVATARGNPLPPETVPCDLTCHAEVESVIERERPEVVIQCAGATRTSDSKQMYALHLGGTLAVLTAVAQYSPSATVILLGSAAEYGPVAAENLPIS